MNQSRRRRSQDPTEETQVSDSPAPQDSKDDTSGQEPSQEAKVANQKIDKTYLERAAIKPFKGLKNATHAYNAFSVVVPNRLSKEILESPEMWRHVGAQLQPGAEVRITALDSSFYAIAYITYSAGSEVRAKLVLYTELESVNYSGQQYLSSPYTVEFHPGTNWCVIKKETGEVIFSDIPTQSKAFRELEEYSRALRS